MAETDTQNSGWFAIALLMVLFPTPPGPESTNNFPLRSAPVSGVNSCFKRCNCRTPNPCIRRDPEISKRFNIEVARTLPMPGIDSKSSETRILAIASLVEANSMTCKTFNFPDRICSLTSARLRRACLARSNANWRCAASSFGGLAN